MPLNLFEWILKEIKQQPPQITHILSYDLRNVTPKTYVDLSQMLQKEFSWVKTHLQSQTVWELCTNESCDVIMRAIISIVWVSCQINIYQVRVLEKKTYPAILPKTLPQK